MEGINIWSGSDIGIGAALTNPTELAFRKNKIKNHYPVTFRGVNFRDAESAYQEYKSRDMQESIEIMTEIIVCKLQHILGYLKQLRSEAVLNGLSDAVTLLE